MHTIGAGGGVCPKVGWGRGGGLMIGCCGFLMTSLKLSILPRFYFHDVLEQLKTNFYKTFRFKMVLGFVIEYA